MIEPKMKEKVECPLDTFTCDLNEVKGLKCD